MTNAVDIKTAGKLLEELYEASEALSRCGKAMARCLIQGTNETEPGTGKSNKQWLEEELADVTANIDLVVERFGLDFGRMQVRVAQKKKRLRQWHRMLT